MTDAPARIYLQVCDDPEYPSPFAEHGGVTWCSDKIHDTDVEYIRADLVPQKEGT